MSVGFLVTFLFGGLTGVILASPPLDFHVTDTYFVVAHFHYVVFGTVVFAMFAGFYFWWPKFTGKMLNERLGKVHFWTLFIGFHTTFLVQHWLGVEGMPRRYADYRPRDGFTTLNLISSLGAFLLGAVDAAVPLQRLTRAAAPKVDVDDPWGFGNSLEWATSCPPPRHNFTSLPRIRSERPAFDLHYPEVAAIELDENPAAAEGRFADAPDMEGRSELIDERTDGDANSEPGMRTGEGARTGDGEHDVDCLPRVTSSVVVVSELLQSVRFYRDLFSREVSIEAHDAALLRSPGGFQTLPARRRTLAASPLRWSRVSVPDLGGRHGRGADRPGTSHPGEAAVPTGARGVGVTF